MSYNDLDAHQLLWHQEGWCIKCGVDFDKVKNQIMELNDLMVNLLRNSFGVCADDTDWDTRSDSIKARKNNENYIAMTQATGEFGGDRAYLNSLANISEQTGIKPNEKSLLDLFTYLLLIEGSYSQIIQMICVLLVDAGHDLFDPIRNDFVKHFEDIQKIDLSIKLKFLDKHGFSLVVNSADRKLRNDIAHLNFRVLEDGKIIDKKNRQEIKDVKEKTKALRWICTLVSTTIEWFSPYYFDESL